MRFAEQFHHRASCRVDLKNNFSLEASIADFTRSEEF